MEPVGDSAINVSGNTPCSASKRSQARQAVHAMAFEGVGLNHEYAIDPACRDADAGLGPFLEVVFDRLHDAGHAPGVVVAVPARLVGFLGSGRDRKTAHPRRLT